MRRWTLMADPASPPTSRGSRASGSSPPSQPGRLLGVAARRCLHDAAHLRRPPGRAPRPALRRLEESARLQTSGADRPGRGAPGPGGRPRRHRSSRLAPAADLRPAPPLRRGRTLLSAAGPGLRGGVACRDPQRAARNPHAKDTRFIARPGRLRPPAERSRGGAPRAEDDRSRGLSATSSPFSTAACDGGGEGSSRHALARPRVAAGLLPVSDGDRPRRPARRHRGLRHERLASPAGRPHRRPACGRRPRWPRTRAIMEGLATLVRREAETL